MKESDQLLEKYGESIGYAREYMAQQVKLIKLELAEKTVLISSIMVNSLVFFVLGLFVFGIGSIALGFYLGERLGSNAEGFLILFVVYLALYVILYALRRRLITNPILERILEILNS